MNRWTWPAVLLGGAGTLAHCSSSSNPTNDGAADGGTREASVSKGDSGGGPGDSSPGDTGGHESGAAEAGSTDTGADAGVCGDPGQACCPGMTCHGATSCVSKVCTCPSGATGCGAACVDEQTDNDNCGGCGLMCSTTCTAGRCLVTLATSPKFSGDLAIDATSAYWTSLGAGGVLRVSLSGGTVTTLASGYMPDPPIAIDATSVYFASNSPPAILSVPLAGGAVSTLASGVDIGDVAPNSIAVDATSVYWPSQTKGIFTVPLTGGTVTTLAAATAAAVTGVAVDSKHLYWGNTSLVRAKLDGTAATTLAAGNASGITLMTLDSKNIYYINPFLVSIPLAGGTVTTISAADQPEDSGHVVVDDTYVYWADTSSGPSYTSTIMKATIEPTDGGAPITLATGQAETFQIAVGDKSLYWINYLDGTLMKLTPK
jgi:hypothetical protein